MTLMSWAVILTSFPEVSTEPLTSASTLSTRAISDIGVDDPLNCMADRLLTTVRAEIVPSSVVSASAIPSA